jgi:beta-glucosidase
MSDTDRPDLDRVEQLVAELTTSEKASLTGGSDVWHLPAIERVGLGSLKMSDGPSGVRGEHWSTRRSLSFPCGIAVGSTWDVDLVARFGTALAAEARSKGVHLLLGPTVCIVRMPLAGRTFESLAEDPHLSSRLTVAYISHVQAGGVGCCVKHFACNDQEHERMTISAEVDEVTLREVHLPSFEAAVLEAGTWSVMSAYNRIDGTYCGEHPELLGRILKGDWAFDGVVVSDWLGTHSTLEATIAGLDVEMPGPPSHLGEKLATAVEDGAVDAAVLDDHARRILRLAQRTGALESTVSVAEAEDDDPQRRAVAHEIAVGGMVLLRNQGVLPLDGTALRRVALIGPNAARLEPGGGGSSTVTGFRDPSLVDELRAQLPDADIAYEEGCRLAVEARRIDPRLLGDGLDLEYFSGTGFQGEPAGRALLARGHFMALGDLSPGVSAGDFSLRATATFVADQDGTWQLGLANAGRARLLLDGEVVIDNTEPVRGDAFFGAGSTIVTTDRDLVAGEKHQLTVELENDRFPLAGFDLLADRPPVPDLLERAVAAAREAEVAIVVVGANSQCETEGADRADLRLLGEQDALVAAVAAANPNTVVVLNAGGPVELPWVDDVAAVLTTWYPGEEGAAALAAVLAGVEEPAGRLPVTFPKRLEDSATYDWYPGEDGKVVYGEGLLVGHRHFDAHDIEPAFCFGHGLGYTTFELGRPAVEGSAPELTVRVPVTNTGERKGSQVVQVYVGAVERPEGRPVRQLAGFAKVVVAAGETVTAEIAIGERAFSRWDVEQRAWAATGGDYELSVGTSSRNLPHTVRVAVS